MAAINMPNSPTDGQTHIADNGVNYVYQAATDRWLVQEDPADGVNLWDRDAGDTELSPIYLGDSVVIKTSAGADAIVLDPEAGITVASGLNIIGSIDVDNLTSLP